MAVPHYAGPAQRAWDKIYRIICGAVLFFLLAPLIVIIPLSFSAESYFVFTKEMLALDPEAFSLRWYESVLNSSEWMLAIRNSFVVALSATAIATALGTLAALGLSQSHMVLRGPIMSILISPMIVPLIVTGVGTYFFFSKIGLAQTLPGLVIVHAALGTPFVVITVTATLTGFDWTLARASSSLGAGPLRTFFFVTLPLILPGVISGALFAFVISFDEPVVVLFLAGFEQTTIPKQMWSGIRENISPDILAVATVLIVVSVGLLLTVEMLRRRSERLKARKF